MRRHYTVRPRPQMNRTCGSGDGLNDFAGIILILLNSLCGLAAAPFEDGSDFRGYPASLLVIGRPPR